MIRCIAAIDNKRGLATDDGIPWDLPSDRKYFKNQTKNSWLLIGWRTYQSLAAPLTGRRNFVLSNNFEPLRPGFELAEDVSGFLQQATSDVWIIGGGALFAQTIQYAEELYLTRVAGDFHCTKFFPNFKAGFHLAQQSEPQFQNGQQFCFEIYISVG